MSATPAKAVCALVGVLVLTSCAPAITEEQLDDARRACSDGFNAQPEVIQQAWDDSYEAAWRVGNLWWTFGAGDICHSLKDDLEAEEWVAHSDDPAWYVEKYQALN